MRNTIREIRTQAQVLESRHSIGHYMDVYVGVRISFNCDYGAEYDYAASVFIVVIRPWHIDTTLVPVRQDMVLTASRKQIDAPTRNVLRDAGIKMVPVPASSHDHSYWHMNLLCIGDGRIIIDNTNKQFNKQLESLGFKTIQVRPECPRCGRMSVWCCNQSYAVASY